MGRLNCLCDECGEIFVATTSGAVCPNGHGRVIPGITAADIERVHRRIAREARDREREEARQAVLAAARAAVAKLPLCRYVHEGSSWAVDGSEECYRRVCGPYSPSTLDGIGESHRAAGRTLARTADRRWCVLEPLPEDRG